MWMYVFDPSHFFLSVYLLKITGYASLSSKRPKGRKRHQQIMYESVAVREKGKVKQEML